MDYQYHIFSPYREANDITLAPFEIVKIASEAEREYIGLNNGLLDQACIA